MDDRLRDEERSVRFAAAVMSLYAALALLLAASGLYGVLSLKVTARTRELGVRTALGARRAQVMRATVRSGLRLKVDQHKGARLWSRCAGPFLRASGDPARGPHVATSSPERAEAIRGDSAERTSAAQLDERHRHLLQRSSSLTGDEFDREYMKVMVQSHQEVSKQLRARAGDSMTSAQPPDSPTTSTSASSSGTHGGTTGAGQASGSSSVGTSGPQGAAMQR